MPDLQHARVAVYLDFDNIVMSWYDRVHGRSAYSRDRQRIAEDATAPDIAEKLAAARGQAAQMLQNAEAYRASVVNEAEGEASRFKAVYEEYAKASEVTRKRLYLETLERVLGDVEKIIIDESAEGGQGVVPYLPLTELRRQGGSN